ncbi:unnamed protein product [Linum tenue]|uniref:Uncharacterized protein n=1 Tax=Linum tenue TaxID=586396 RepID=A0AAV0NR14_9ROSI|nr:unnamed protein product [Linum tenue]
MHHGDFHKRQLVLSIKGFQLCYFGAQQEFYGGAG